MNILILIGLNKKSGETIKQINIFKNHLSNYSDIEIDTIYLKEYTLHNCLGCNICFDKGECCCPIKDDKEIILNKMIKSDGIIITSSVYSLHITSDLKILIDRLSYLIHRPIFFEKKAMIVIPKGIFFPEPIKYLKKILTYWGFDIVNTNGFAIIDNFPEKQKAKMINDIKRQINIFYMSIKNKDDLDPSINDIVSYKMWKYRAKEFKDINNADYLYFEGNNLFNKHYYNNIKIGLFKSICSNFLFKIALIYMKKGFGDLSKSL